VNDFFLNFVCVSILNVFVVNEFNMVSTKTSYPAPLSGRDLVQQQNTRKLGFGASLTG